MTYGRNAPSRKTTDDTQPVEPVVTPRQQSEAAVLHAQVRRASPRTLHSPTYFRPDASCDLRERALAVRRNAVLCRVFACSPAPLPVWSRMQVSAEIAERQQFLEHMRAMGKGEEHEAPIRLQVAERMGELGTLERMMRED